MGEGWGRDCEFSSLFLTGKCEDPLVGSHLSLINKSWRVLSYLTTSAIILDMCDPHHQRCVVSGAQNLWRDSQALGDRTSGGIARH